MATADENQRSGLLESPLEETIRSLDEDDCVSWNGGKGQHEKTSLGFPVSDAEGRLIEEAVERAKKAAAEASNALIQGATPHKRTTTLGEVLDLSKTRC